jgi:FAD/FMN-containing dehydrogenase
MTIKAVMLDGGETGIDQELLDNLRTTVRGAVLTPGDPGYDAIRPVYNAMHTDRPAVVVQAAGTADVIDAINFAREQGLLLAVRGGGHSVAGLSSVDGGVLLDLALMNGVDVDPDAKLVRAQGGALWRDVDRETQVFALATPGGVVSDTGIAGLTLGGGEGWMRRKFGLSCDSLVSVQVVDASGKVRTASADTNADLFWAIRGGGGNFGVVTSFTFRLYHLGPTVAFAAAFHPIGEAPQVLRGFRAFMSGAPDEVTGLAVMTTLPPSQHTPPEIHDTPFIATAGVYAGDVDEGMKVMQPLRGLGTHLADISGPIPFLGVQTAFDEFFRRQVLRSYWKSTYLSELTDEAVDLVAAAAKERNSPRTLIALFSWGGAINRVGAEETAHAERAAQWMVSVDGNWHDPADDDRVITWVRERWAAIHKLGTGSTYLNFTGIADESTDVGVDSAFGRNRKRLAEIKKKYDPDNFFRLNNNIKPA